MIVSANDKITSLILYPTSYIVCVSILKSIKYNASPSNIFFPILNTSCFLGSKTLSFCKSAIYTILYVLLLLSYVLISVISY